MSYNNFRTSLRAQAAAFSINHQHRILSIGSCFAEQMGCRLAAAKFDVVVNPFGITYHPLLMAEQLSRLVGGQVFSANELLERDGLWHSFKHHSSFSNISAECCLEKINNSFLLAKEKIQNIDFLILTLGTSYVYELTSSNETVNNCHKYPSNYFRKRVTELEEFLPFLSNVFEKLVTLNPNLRVLLTVSPIRHLRDGFLENQRSKARLVLACERLCEQFRFVHYFAAYELMLDDLRDYRFYEADMLHPNELAQNYIWSFFCDNYFDDYTKKIESDVAKLTRALQHRAFQPELPQHRFFLLQQLEKIGQMEAQYPFLNFEPERETLRLALQKIS